jgi:hypothetical protein
VIRLLAATVGIFALLAAGAEGATLQPIGGFSSPMYVTSPPTEPDRLLVAQRGGRIEQVREGAISNFADLEAVVDCCAGENGLQSIAVAPDFGSTGRFYVDYTGLDGNIHVVEMRAIGATAPLTTLREVLTIPHPDGSTHNGGQLQFGPEGLLYISTGDGGGENGQYHTAQNPASPLGKILRIDPLPSGEDDYSIPAGNPIPGSEVWSLGLRNPYRFSFDAAGGMLIGDVGQGLVEEVDYAPPGAPGGANYGWNCFEGTLAGPGPPFTDPECEAPPAKEYVAPIFEYPHPFGCAIIGGYVVRDRSLGDLYGRYVYTDYCGEQIRSFALADPASTDRSEGLSVIQPTSFGEDSCGRLYIASREGLVARFTGPGANPCSPVAAAPLGRTFVGIRAASRRVKRNKRATITAWVSPCGQRKGDRVSLYRGARRIGTRRLDTVCSARFRPRISRRWRFRAVAPATATHEADVSRKLTVVPRKHRRR